MTQPPCIFPTFRCRDPDAAVAFLKAAFGFVVTAEHRQDGAIAHAELALGGSVIMLGAVRKDDYGRLVGEPGNQGGKSLYLAVEDIDAAFRSAEAAGAEILEPLVDRDYGSREFICRDPEGSIWCLGTYRPQLA
ncbi:glyoxalase [Rhodovarius crocodyli]|uniref:Glyoxalase n=1 Tax=Rhodovarius crocodyli TaxID=1979269 RepID=A0A437M1W9_9PROT|nr:VOC family protein [Rhodovarius crocodyli]RVT91709.1 glyoxalase [Rhodovarius crocodyli]